MPKTTPMTFKVTFNTHGLPGVLDMLRYERGTIEDWAPVPGGERFTVTIRLDDHYRHAPDRWRSFGLYPYSEDDCGKVAPWGAVCTLAPGHPTEHDWRFNKEG